MKHLVECLFGGIEPVKIFLIGLQILLVSYQKVTNKLRLESCLLPIVLLGVFRVFVGRQVFVEDSLLAPITENQEVHCSEGTNSPWERWNKILKRKRRERKRTNSL